MTFWDMMNDRPSPEGFDIKQVCLHGHVINNRVVVDPGYNEDFCKTCGAKTITSCPSCNANMRGFDHDSNLFGFPDPAPSYCIKCGAAFPWRQSLIDAAVELAQEGSSADDGTLLTLRESMGDLGKDSPRTELAIVRVKKFIAGAGKAVAPSLTKMAFDLGTDAVKKHFGI